MALCLGIVGLICNGLAHGEDAGVERGCRSPFLGFAGMLRLLVAIRMPVGLAMLGGRNGLATSVSWALAIVHAAGLRPTPYHLFANFTLSVIPLFILMGAFAEKSGLSTAAVSGGGCRRRPPARRPRHGA